MLRMMRVLMMGLVAGTIVAFLLALGCWALYRDERYGLATLAIGVPLGFALLLIGFCCSAAAYWLARRDRSARLRHSLLLAAPGFAAAGVACGSFCTLAWLMAGRPVFG